MLIINLNNIIMTWVYYISTFRLYGNLVKIVFKCDLSINILEKCEMLLTILNNNEIVFYYTNTYSYLNLLY